MALGSKGATIIALGITISILGFLSQSVLTAPRVYFAMAEDGVFFRQLSWIHPRTRVPIFAIIAAKRMDGRDPSLRHAMTKS